MIVFGFFSKKKEAERASVYDTQGVEEYRRELERKAKKGLVERAQNKIINRISTSNKYAMRAGGIIGGAGRIGLVHSRNTLKKYDSGIEREYKRRGRWVPSNRPFGIVGADAWVGTRYRTAAVRRRKKRRSYI